MSHELTHLDLFSGIGGFALAAQRAGFRTIGFSEVEPYACRLLAERFPGKGRRNFGDVRNLDAFAGLQYLTIISAGYPCQPFSLGGERRGPEDDRHLWPAARKVIQLCRPTWFIGENVLGHVSLGLDQVLHDLESDGYAAQPFIVPACAIGAAHFRARVWIVAHSEREGLAGCNQGAGISCAKETPRAKPGDAILGTWSELDAASRDLLPRHGLSIKMARNAVRGYGNAIVPQVAEPFFHWIAQIERGEIA